MTLAVAITCPEGVAVSTDSRICLEMPDERAPGQFTVQPFSDSSTKLAVFHDRFAVAWCGRGVSDTSGAQLEALRRDPAVQAAAEAPAFRRALVEALRAHAGSMLLLCYIDAAGAPRVWIAAGADWKEYNFHAHGRQLYGYFPVGFHDFLTGRLIREDRVPFANFTLQQAVSLSRWCVQTQIDVQDFEAGPRFVGGPIVTAVATPTGAQMLQPPALTAGAFGMERIWADM